MRKRQVEILSWHLWQTWVACDPGKTACRFWHLYWTVRLVGGSTPPSQTSRRWVLAPACGRHVPRYMWNLKYTDRSSGSTVEPQIIVVHVFYLRSFMYLTLILCKSVGHYSQIHSSYFEHAVENQTYADYLSPILVKPPPLTYHFLSPPSFSLVFLPELKSKKRAKSNRSFQFCWIIWFLC